MSLFVFFSWYHSSPRKIYKDQCIKLDIIKILKISTKCGETGIETLKSVCRSIHFELLVSKIFLKVSICIYLHLSSIYLSMNNTCPLTSNWGILLLEVEFLVRTDFVSYLQVKVLLVLLCPTPHDPMHCSPPGFSVHRICQARILESVAIPFSRGSSWPQGSNPGLLH